MTTGKKILYILFAAVTVAIAVCMTLWNVLDEKIFLFVAIGFFAVFSFMFLYMLIVNRKTGWRGEKTLAFRIAREPLFCDLYILRHGKKRYTVDVYPAGEPEKYYELLKAAEREDGDAMEELGDACLGQLSLTAEQLGALRGKTVATSAVIHAALGSNRVLKEFLVKNTFLFY